MTEHHETAQRMAAAIVHITQEHGYCTRDDLACAGFTPAEIDRHSQLARSLAAVTLNSPRNDNFEPSEK